MLLQRPANPGTRLSATDDRTWGRNPPGAGAIDFEGVSAQLSAIGYLGASTLEVVIRRAPEGHFRGRRGRLRAHGWAA